MAADPDILVFLTSAKTEFEGRAMAAALEAEGIPAKVFAAAARMVQWEAGYNDPIKVMVRRVDRARAAEVLQRNRIESRQIDWSQVDVHAPGVLADGSMCEFCGSALAGLPTDTAECPTCGSALLPQAGEERAAESEARAPFAVRWAGLRRVGGVMLFMGMALGVLGPAFSIPLIGIALWMIVFGGRRSSAAPKRPAAPRS